MHRNTIFEKQSKKIKHRRLDPVMAGAEWRRSGSASGREAVRSRERGMQPRHAWIKARRTIAKVAMKVAMAGVGPKPGERRGGRQKGSETVLICLKYL